MKKIFIKYWKVVGKMIITFNNLSLSNILCKVFSGKLGQKQGQSLDFGSETYFPFYLKLHIYPLSTFLSQYKVFNSVVIVFGSSKSPPLRIWLIPKKSIGYFTSVLDIFHLPLQIHSLLFSYSAVVLRG